MTTLYDRILFASMVRGRTPHEIETGMELIFEALETLFRPPVEVIEEGVNAQYETMEAAAFAVAKAARAYVKVVASRPDLSSLVQAYSAMRDEVAKFEEMADQYERSWE
jgi:hypothetical protein